MVARAVGEAENSQRGLGLLAARSTFFRARARIARLLERAALASARYKWQFFARAHRMARLLEML